MLDFSLKVVSKKDSELNVAVCVSGVMLTCICSRSTLRSAILVT